MILHAVSANHLHGNSYQYDGYADFLHYSFQYNYHDII